MLKDYRQSERDEDGGLKERRTRHEDMDFPNDLDCELETHGMRGG